MAPYTSYRTRIFISISVLTTYCLPIVGEHAEGTACGPRGLQEDEPTALLQTSSSLAVRARGSLGSTFPAAAASDAEQLEVRRDLELPDFDSQAAGIELAEARMQALSAQLSELTRSQQAIGLEDTQFSNLEVQLTSTTLLTTQSGIVVDVLSENVTRFVNYTQIREERENHSMKYFGMAQKFSLSDWRYFVAAVAFSLALSTMFLCCYSCLRKGYVLCYSYHSWEEQTPYPASRTLCGWIGDSARLQTQDVMRFSGLDTAMFLRFTVMCIKAIGSISILILIVYIPLHALFGIAPESTQYLLSIDDLEPDLSWVWWIHSVVLVLVIILASYFVLNEMQGFLPFRFLWLQTMPYPRCQTVLVENLPVGMRTEARLRDFFNTILAKDVVQQCSIVRNTAALSKHWQDIKYWKDYIDDANQRARRTGKRPMIHVGRGGPQDEIAYYERKQGDSKLLCDEERRRLKMQENVQSEHPVLSSSGFVTFVSPQDTEIARLMVYAPTTDIILSVPPDPADVIYTDLVMNEKQKTIFAVLGFILLAILFALYCAIVATIAYVGEIHFMETELAKEFGWIREWPFLEDAYNGVFQPLTLTVFLLILPMILGLILPLFFQQNSQANGQYQLQRIYYVFLFCFALIFFCLGFSIVDNIRDFVSAPETVHNWIIKQFILASSFYVKFIPVQWMFMSFGLLRLLPLARFCWYRRKYNPVLTRELSEPEDTSLYGIGSRSAYSAFLATVTLIFCQISPLVGVLGFHTFGFLRIIMGYFLVFTETRKPDLGGTYFVQQLHYVFLALHVYGLLMAGYITYYSNQAGPTIIAWAGFLLLLYLYFFYFMKIQWETLPAEDMDLMGRASRPSTRSTYLQPELETQANLFQYDSRDRGVKTGKEQKKSGGIFAGLGCFEADGDQDKDSEEKSVFQDFTESWSGPPARYGADR
mmetsp:Transcript_146451/g.255402  ORF Transcript_146451/g.255402 Transcript_146451/m.255402 type:complete len:932 (+) Transcript_146451:21-2816(+)